jgi:PiT family inorganic phosphate transporter
MSLAGAILGGSAVAFTLAGLVSLPSADQTIIVLLVGLITASSWNIITWHFALPSSSTHALVGGLVGGGIAAAGMGSVNWGVDLLLSPSHELTGIVLILSFFFISVFIGFAGSYCLHRVSMAILRNAKRSVNRTIVRLNWIAVAGMAFFNGANDTQKQMGIIALALAAMSQSAAPTVPLWVRLSCAVLLALGTISGGWRIMKTLGSHIFKLAPVHSFASQFFSTTSLALATIVGAPVSSTQVITMSVIGTGAAENLKKVRWSTGKHILAAMGITIVATMLIAAILYRIIAPIAGV